MKRFFPLSWYVTTAFWCAGWAAYYAAFGRWGWAAVFGALASVHVSYARARWRDEDQKT